MDFRIRKFTRSDIPAIHELIMELAIFEKAPGKVKNTIQQMEEEMDCFECLVAELDSGEIAGMALFYEVYYTWVGKSMYLDDLVVKNSLRGNGVGTRLLDRVIEESKSRKCKRLRWQVLDWNKKAIDMYRKYGCDLDSEWINCDLSYI